MLTDPDDPRLTAYALGELDGVEIAEIETLLIRSDESRRLVDEVRATAKMLAESLSSERLPGLSTRHREAIEGELAPTVLPLPQRPPSRLQRWAGYGVAASLLMGFGLSAAWMMRPRAGAGDAHAALASNQGRLRGEIAMAPAPMFSSPLAVEPTPPNWAAQGVAPAPHAAGAQVVVQGGSIPAQQHPGLAYDPPAGPQVAGRAFQKNSLAEPAARTSTGLGTEGSSSHANRLTTSTSKAKGYAMAGAAPVAPVERMRSTTDPAMDGRGGRLGSGTLAEAPMIEAPRDANRSAPAAPRSSPKAARRPQGNMDQATIGDELLGGGRLGGQGTTDIDRPPAPPGADASKFGYGDGLAATYDRHETNRQSLMARVDALNGRNAAMNGDPQSAALARNTRGMGLPQDGPQSKPGQNTQDSVDANQINPSKLDVAATAEKQARVEVAVSQYARLKKREKKGAGYVSRGEIQKAESELAAAQQVRDATPQDSVDKKDVKKVEMLAKLGEPASAKPGDQAGSKPGAQKPNDPQTGKPGDAKSIPGDKPGEAQGGKAVEAEQLALAPVDAFDAREAPAADNNNNNEEFQKVEDNPFVSAILAPLSTFSIDVDTASYAIVRSKIMQQNVLPPPAAVRVEEMVNYFSYDYPAPTTSTPDAPPFSVSCETARCAWNPDHRLARIGLKGKVEERKSPSNLVFLIDVSGSMDQANKLPYVQASMRMLTEQLGENDRVSIVVYAGAAGLVLDSVGGYDKPRIAGAIDRLKAGGSTAGGEGINLAYAVAVKNFIHGGVNRVILATDGDFNVGVADDEALKALAAEKAKTGVFLSVLAFGTGNLKDAKMEGIADKGNGNYAYIDSLMEARKVLVEQMGGTLVTVAKDVKIQVDFNPAKVGSYRLIGYENRMLAAQDFADDTKDAGEIGAGHTVTALYELAPPGGLLAVKTEPALESKYTKKAKAPEPAGDPDSDESFTVNLRYKAPDGAVSTLIAKPVVDAGADFSKASDDFKFASSVAAFGMILRGSPYQGSATFDGLLEWAESSKGKDKGKYRAEFCDIVRKARDLARGK